MASWILGLLTYAIGRAWRVRLRGIARQVSSARGSGRSGRKTVVDLRVEPTDPRHRSFPLVPVELAGAEIHGTVLPNDEIELRGVFRRGNYLSTRGIRVLRTGQLVRATRSKAWLVWLVIWLALTVALVLGVR